MSEAGYIYLLSNSKMPGLVKVGRTARDPSQRAAELSSATGVPSPFDLVYCVCVEDAVGAEQIAHDMMSQWGMRESQSREFFRIDLKLAIDVLLSLPNQLDRLPVENPGETLSSEEMISYIVQLAQQAVNYKSGTGGLPRDLEASLAIYRKLVRFGKNMFLPKVADIMYLMDEERAPLGKRPEFRKSKIAAKESLSYSDEACNILAIISASERNVQNFIIYKNRYIKWLNDDYDFVCTSPHVEVDNYARMKAFDIWELLVAEKNLRGEVDLSPDLSPFVSDIIWVIEELGESGDCTTLAKLVEVSESWCRKSANGLS